MVHSRIKKLVLVNIKCDICIQPIPLLVTLSSKCSIRKVEKAQLSWLD